MTEGSRQFTRSDYTVGWICALPDTELAAARAMLDEEHKPPPSADLKDSNVYVFGEIGDHNVVIACLPSQLTGKVSAANIASNMIRSFGGIRFGLMVGVGGGAPYFYTEDNSDSEDDDSEDEQDIRLGDVVVSQQKKGSAAVLQYDFGRSLQGKEFIRTGGDLNKPPIILLNAISLLRSEIAGQGQKISRRLTEIRSNDQHASKRFLCPGPAKDRLFKSAILHVDGKKSCRPCCGPLDINLVKRKDRGDTDPRIHYGTIGSADQVMQDAILRDKWAQKEKIMCFEMEAAGLMDSFPCLVIRGICDYADSHKKRTWQPYAAATAAAFAKELLLVVPGQGVRDLPAIEQALRDQTTQVTNLHHKVDLAKLQCVEGAGFDSHVDEHEPRCLENTRTELLHEIAEWAAHRQGKCIFWLNGMAGTGKSTISRTVAQFFNDKCKLGGSFFFKKGEGDRGNASRFFTTIAAQLAAKIPNLGPLITKAIDTDPRLPEKALKEQFEKLILQPLSRISSISLNTPKLVLVVDALDECEREADIKAILVLLPQLRDVKAVCLKVLVTSRPDLPIRLGFNKMADGTYEDLVLHDIPQSTIKHDISIFFQNKLSEIRDERLLGRDWPNQETIEALVEMAVPLFIFAATVCRFVGDTRWDPKERLATVLKYQTASQTSKLDGLYTPILDQLLVGQDKLEREHLAAEFQELVGTIVMLAEPLSIVALASLLGIERAAVARRLCLLHSVLNVPNNQFGPVRLLHLSFRDFLLKSERSENSPFSVNEEDTHRRIAIKCLELLSKSNVLKKDICGLRRPGTLRSAIDSQTVNYYLPAEVQYACRYWFHHLKRAHSGVKENDQVHIFLQDHLIHWLEAMSLLRKTSESIVIISDLLSICEFHKSRNLYALIFDAKRFALNNRWVIDEAPLQLYCSALVFCPEESSVRRLFQKYIPCWIQKKSKVHETWSEVLLTLEGHSEGINSVTFSPNGKVVASASDDKTVRLWDAGTGEHYQTLEGHTEPVGSVTFSPDGRVIASASMDKTARLWDAATGTALRRYEGHSSYVYSVAFSPDGDVVASASDDSTVMLWDAATGDHYHTLEGHLGSVSSVAFSPDGKMIASASLDKTARLWNAATGELLQTFEDHTGQLASVAFSPDSKMVASAAGVVILWDAATGEPCHKLEDHLESVESVAFSPTGGVVATASEDKTVKLWRAVDGEQYDFFEGHLKSVSSVAFSPDGMMIASASLDKTIKLWDIRNEWGLSSKEGGWGNKGRHWGIVNSVVLSTDGSVVMSMSDDNRVVLWQADSGAAVLTLDGISYCDRPILSPDGNVFASPSEDNTIRLCDTATGMARCTLEGHLGFVKSVAFSPDGNRVASASIDNTVRIWGASTGVAQHTLEGHSASVNLVAFSPDGNMVASASSDYTARLWNPVTGAALCTIEVGAVAESLSFSSSGQYLNTDRASLRLSSFTYLNSADLSKVESGMKEWVSEGEKDILWLGVARQALKRQSANLNSTAFSPDGNMVASASIDNTVRIWSAATGAAQHMLKGHWATVNSVAFSPDGNMVASASDDSTVRIWDTATATAQLTLEGHSANVKSVAFSPDGNLVASASNDYTVRLWNPVTGAALRTIEVGVVVEFVSFSSSEQKLNTDRGSFELSSLSGYLNSPDLWKLTSGMKEWVSEDEKDILWLGQARQTLAGHLGRVKSVAFSPDGNMVASASNDNTIRLCHTLTGVARQTLERHSANINSVAFSPDGDMCASASNDNTVRLWDTATGAARQTLEGHSADVNSAVFSPDGNMCASASNDNTVRLWDTATGAARQTFEGHSADVNSVVFSSDGNMIASASNDKTVRLWNPVTGMALRTIEVGVVAEFLSFSRSGQYLNTNRGVFRLTSLWNSSNLTDLVKLTALLKKGVTDAEKDIPWLVMARQTLEDHLGRCTSVAFSPDGNLVASASSESTVRIWDAATAVARQTLEGHSSNVSLVVFSPDGNMVASASKDKTVRLWNPVTGAALRTIEVEEVVESLSFSRSGEYLNTDKEPFRISSSNSCYSADLSNTLSVMKEWVTEDENNILWLPPDFRANCLAMSKGLIVLGHSSGIVSLLQFTQDPKVV